MDQTQTTRDKRKQYAQRQRQARRLAGLVDMPGFFPASTAAEVRKLAKRENVSVQRVIPVLVEVSLSLLERTDPESVSPIHERIAKSLQIVERSSSADVK